MPIQGVTQASTQVGSAIANIHNQQQSANGPTAVPVKFDFSLQSIYQIDMSILNNFQTIDFVQTIYIDNADNAFPCIVYNPTSQQRIIAPPYTQGWYPFICPNPGRFTVSASGANITYMELVNFPVAPATWNATGGSGGFHFNGDGALITADEYILAALDASQGPSYIGVIDEVLKPLISDEGGGDGLAVNVLHGGGGGGGGGTSLWWGKFGNNGNNGLTGPGTGGQICHITSVALYCTPDVADGVGGVYDLDVYLNYPLSPFKTSIYVPAAAPAVIPTGMIVLAEIVGIDIPATANSQTPYVYFGGSNLISGKIIADIYGYAI